MVLHTGLVLRKSISTILTFHNQLRTFGSENGFYIWTLPNNVKDKQVVCIRFCGNVDFIVGNVEFDGQGMMIFFGWGWSDFLQVLAFVGVHFL